MTCGVSAHFVRKQKKLRKNVRGYYLVQVCVFKKRTQLGPDTDPYLDQIMTPQKMAPRK